MRFEKVSLSQYLEDSAGDTMYMNDGTNPLQISLVRERRVIMNSFSTFIDDVTDEDIYNSIKLPKRATKKSAGYDIYAPYGFALSPGRTIKIATGIKVLLDEDKFLMCVPRSGLGFKARVQLDNTVGIIDADYSESKNEGHIMIKLTNDSRDGKYITVAQGDAIAQGIILQYFKVDDDDTTARRDGGFGSTDNRK